MLDAGEASTFRRGVGFLIYVAGDRPDVQFPTQLLAQWLSSPTAPALLGLKHLTRYLIGTKDKYFYYPRGDGKVHELTATSDSNCATDGDIRRSTGCGVISAAGCCLFTFGRRQAVVSLSSAEAEFYACVATVSEAIATRRLLEHAGLGRKTNDGYDLTLRTRLDSSGARAVLNRQGVGRIRHLEARVLWIQDRVAATG